MCKICLFAEELQDSEVPSHNPEEQNTEEYPDGDFSSIAPPSDVPPPLSLPHPLLPNLPLDHSMHTDMATLMNSSISSLDSSVPPIDIPSLLIDPAALHLESSVPPAEYPVQLNESESAPFPSETDGVNQGFSDVPQSLKSSLSGGRAEAVSPDLVSFDSHNAHVKDEAAPQ